MPSERLTSYLHGIRVGEFSRTGGVYRFRYDDAWRLDSGRQIMSLSLPKSRAEHTGDHVANFLWNLLPDDDRTLQRWAAAFGLKRPSPLALLEHVGLDCAGAVQFAPGNDDTVTREGGVDELSRHQIAAHLGSLRGDPTEWVLPTEHHGYFSLAGAQAKVALRRTPEGWGVPWGFEASTHIIKPGIQTLPHQELVEHLSLATGEALGLKMASSSIESFEGSTVIVSERYDRRVDSDGRVARLHQEDFCQALGLNPAVKYQSQGGPGILMCVDLLRDALRGHRARQATEDFLIVNAFNWLISGSDAHSKNYSLMHTETGSSLAPFYDVASSLPYRKSAGLSERKVALAMSIDRKYRVWEIEPRHIAREADAAGVDGARILDTLRTMAERLPSALSTATRQLDGLDVDQRFLAEFETLAADRSARVLDSLDR